MSFVEYDKAQKAGLKALKSAKKGEEYLPVLDEILKGAEIVGETNLGVVSIPLDKVVGTSTAGRTQAFANNFMPLLEYKTEFGAKWSSLCDSHLEEGIREPIKVYEYLNEYYVVEGNKRVSVMKYFEAVTIPAQVTRKIPKLTDDPYIKIYYEYMEFNKLTTVNYLWFSEEGSFNKMLELTCEDPTKPWTDEQIKDFGSANNNFCRALKSKGIDKLTMTEADAFLVFIEIYGYVNIKHLMQSEMAEKLESLKDELVMESKGGKLELSLEPSKAGRRNLIEFFKGNSPKKLMVAFVFDKNPDESDWLYGHELGRLYIDEHYGDNIKTVKVHNLRSEEELTTAMEDLILMGVNVIFTTSTTHLTASLKVAAEHPDVIVMNCSINTVHKVLKTYYARLYEVKFLAGMLAGAMAQDDKIGYLADYPIVTTPANINAFALGARMVNPYAKVSVKWTSVKNVTRESAIEEFKKEGISYISDQFTYKSGHGSRRFGLYSIAGDETKNIAIPMYNWGVFYSKLIDSIQNGSFKQDDAKNEAVNYWWGLPSGVVDIIYSEDIPAHTLRLVDTVKNLIVEKKFEPFEGEIIAQDGSIKNVKNKKLTPSEVLAMNWLVDNVIGDIPEIDEIKDEAKSIVELKGVTDEDTALS